VKDQPLGTIDDLIAEIAGIPIEELAKEPTEDGQHLISVDELRAAGALDVPAAWRKSLAEETRYTLPGFGEDDENAESLPAPHFDSKCAGPAHELS
jgi:hypothetical protein